MMGTSPTVFASWCPLSVIASAASELFGPSHFSSSSIVDNSPLNVSRMQVVHRHKPAPYDQECPPRPAT